MINEKNDLKSTELRPVNVAIYRYWSAMYRSFYSRWLYVDVGTRWRGFGLLYLLLIVALFSIPYSLSMSFHFKQMFQEQIIDPIGKIPVFYVQNGDVSFDKPMPYLIKSSDGQVVIIIDTTGKINDFSPQYPELIMLINKSKIAFKIPEVQFLQSEQGAQKIKLIVQNFDKHTNFLFDGKTFVVENSIKRLKLVAQIMIYPLFVSFLYSIVLVFFSVLGFLGQIFARVFFSMQLSFMQSSRLLVVASTPMLLFLLTMLALQLVFSGSGNIFLALLLLYYCFALYSVRSEGGLTGVQAKKTMIFRSNSK